IRQESIKIAYLMSVRFFGDTAITSKHGGMYREALDALSDSDIRSIGLIGGFCPSLPEYLPKPKKNQHLLACVRISDTIYSSVSLFGLFNFVLQSPANDFPPAMTLEELFAGEIIALDVKTRKTSSSPALPSLKKH